MGETGKTSETSRDSGIHGKAESRAARQERLSAAMRANLKRRKAQARERAEAGQGGNEATSPDKRPGQG